MEFLKEMQGDLKITKRSIKALNEQAEDIQAQVKDIQEK